MRNRYRNSLRSSLHRTVVFVASTMLIAALPATALAKPVRLFVDAGHGGKDPGAVSGGLAEKDTTLKISKLVAKSAKRQGWKVKMSRDKDVFVPLGVRSKKSNRWKATAFVSVHNNSTGRKSLGNMTIYRGKSSGKLGRSVMREMGKLTPYEDIGNRRDVRNLSVLRETKAPAVLVEVLSVSSPKERRALKNADQQKAIAEAIVKGVAKNQGVKYVPPGGSKPKAKKAKPKTQVQTPKPVPVPAAKAETVAPVSKAPVQEPTQPRRVQPVEPKRQWPSQPVEPQRPSTRGLLANLWNTLVK